MSSRTDVPLHHLEQLVRRVSRGTEPIQIAAMPGGASTRKFFRVHYDAGASAVAIYVPEAGRPDAVAKVDERGRRWPFLEVRDLLEERGIRVPRLLAEATEHGFILVEDLGDDTLAEYLVRAPASRPSVYATAVRDLARAQESLSNLPPDSIIVKRAFDYDLLKWEIDHFREWGLEARGVRLAPADAERFEAIADYLARTIASWSRGFVHRDYQSRNLMVLDGERLAWVDFQDALLGPRVYDLVALLNDSYQTFDAAFIDARLDEYAAERRFSADDRAELGREFALVTVQRKLKDAGRFVYIDRVKGDASYLRFVDSTLEKVDAALERLAADPMMQELKGLLHRNR